MTRALSRRIAGVRTEGDRGMLSMFMLIVIIAMGIGALLVPIIVNQAKSTTHIDSRVQALHEAQDGLDVMLGQIRNVTADGGIIAQVSSLPCLPLSTTLTSPASYYSVSVQYFASDPLATPGLAALACPLSSTAPPLFARITSVGTDSTGGSASSRMLSTSYPFSGATNFNVTAATLNGGQIRLTTPPLIDPPTCIDAGLAPAASLSVTIASCGSSLTRLIYRSDLALVLSGTTTTTSLYGLCITSVAATSIVNLQACAAPGAASYLQQWNYTNSTFAGIGANSALCLGVTATVLQTNLCSAATAATWLPTPSVGAGAAGVANNQLVNLSQFDKCAAWGGPASLPPSLATCQQQPTAAQVDQKFSYSPSTQQLVATNSGQSYCLTTAALNAAVTMPICSTGLATQKWTKAGFQFTQPIAAGGLQCLSLNPTYTLISAPCAATAAPDAKQLWNADPTTLTANLPTNTNETPGQPSP